MFWIKRLWKKFIGVRQRDEGVVFVETRLKDDPLRPGTTVVETAGQATPTGVGVLALNIWIAAEHEIRTARRSEADERDGQLGRDV